MEKDYFRKVIEIEALYLVEPQLKDIYVEGSEEVNFFEIYLDSEEINVISIDNVDFNETTGVGLKSNKEKVLYLNNYVSTACGNGLPYITFIVDRDFDTITDSIIESPYLEYTDFANLEMYFFNNESITKFLKIGLKNFPLEGEYIINVFETVLLDLFAIRYSRAVVNCSYKMLELDKLIKFKEAEISYSNEELLTKFLSKNGALSQKGIFEQEIKNVKDKYIELNEIRLFVHGKDFFELFFLLIKKVKNTYSFNIKSFVRAFFASIEINSLKQYVLFQNIDNKYLKSA